MVYYIKCLLDKQWYSHFLDDVISPTISTVEQSRSCLVKRSKNDLFPTTQSAYRKYNSTETALLRIMNDILQAIDRHEDTILVLLDLSVAFDTFDHQMLLNILHQRFGSQDLALYWLTSYLSERKQSVRINYAISADNHLCCGVPQGSVLGLVLFSMYVDLVEDPMVSVLCSTLTIVGSTS